MLVTIFLGFLALLLFLFYRKRNLEKDIFVKMGIPGPKPHWFFGNMVLPEVYALQLYEWTKTYGNIYGFYQGALPILCVSDLDFIQQVLCKQSRNFHGRKELPLQPDPESENGINMISAKGKRWKRLRSVVNPTFSTGKLKQISNIVNEKICDSLKQLEELSNKGDSVDVLKIYQKLTMAIIKDVAYGLIDDDESFLQHCRNFFELIDSKPGIIKVPLLFPEVRRLLYWYVQYSAKIICPYIIDLPDQWMHNKFRKIIAERRKQKCKRVDMLTILMEAVASGDDDLTMTEEDVAVNSEKGSTNHTESETKKSRKTLSDEEAVGQCFLFLLAGYDTSSNSLSFLSYLLAMNPDKQKKLIKEIDESITSDDNVTYDNVMRLSYLNMCVKEMMRLYPAACSQVVRRCENSTVVNGIHIPEGVLVQVDAWSVHHNPDLWGPVDAWKFEPERFTPENMTKHHPMQYLPFGAGPRNCVGMRFGLMEVKLTMVHVLRKFSFEKCEKTEEDLKIRDAVTLSATNGVYLKLINRKNSF